MAITTFAAIDLGSSAISMNIYEVSKKYGIKELDHINKPLRLGLETYKNSSISYHTVEEICSTLTDFQEIAKAYKVDFYEAYATSALREAKNNLVILDQIKLRTGTKVKIISNSEQRFLCYQAIALKEDSFANMIKKGMLIVDIGAGSIQLSYFVNSALEFTQNLKLGYSRIEERLGSINDTNENYMKLIGEYIDHDISTFMRRFLHGRPVQYILAVCDKNTNLRNYMQAKGTFSANELTKDEYGQFYKMFRSETTQSMGALLHLSSPEIPPLVQVSTMYKKIMEQTKATKLHLCTITLCDGMVAEYAQRKDKIVSEHDFLQDIINTSENLALKYDAFMPHNKKVEYFSLQLFDSIRKLHGLGKRERLLLQIAAILHNCGSFVNMTWNGYNSCEIIRSTEIIGLSHSERELIAQIVSYYDTRPTKEESGLDNEQYLMMVKLSTLLELANVLDVSNKQKIDTVKISLRNGALTITASSSYDISLEQAMFDREAEFFEEVYGIRPILKLRRRLSHE